MNMIGHNNIACYIKVLLIKMIKPFVNGIISIGYFKKLQPFITSEGYKIKAVIVLIVLKANRHALKIMQVKIPGSLPRTRPGEKNPGRQQTFLFYFLIKARKFNCRKLSLKFDFHFGIVVNI
jgi:hypothetical protein